MRWRSLPVSLLFLGVCAGRLHADVVKELRDAVDNDYSYRDLHHVDWPALFRTFDARLAAVRSPGEFVQVTSELLASARDIHITIHAGTNTTQPFHPDVPANYDLKLIPALVPDVKSDHHCVSAGHTIGGFGYIIIGEWTDTCARSAQAALDQLSNTRGIVVDVRPNAGGDDRLAAEFAGRFVDKRVIYAYVESRSHGQFGQKLARFLEPSSRPHFHGPVAVLMGPRCMSSNESFLLMMRAAGGKLVGGHSFGSSGNPLPHHLSNGVVVNLPSWREYQPTGALVEGNGIEPDRTVAWPAVATGDVVLRAAMAELQQQQ